MSWKRQAICQTVVIWLTAGHWQALFCRKCHQSAYLSLSMAEKRAAFIFRRFLALGFSKRRCSRNCCSVCSRSSFFLSRRMARSTGSPFLSLTSDIVKTQFVAQKDLTRHAIEVGFLAVTLTAQFPDGQLAAARHSLGQRVTQIKIPAHAFAALANKTKHRFCMVDIHFVLHLTVLVHALRIEIRQVHGQTF